MALVSIITITYNAEQFLERTIQSIRAQTISDYEYIIVDGASTDGTMNIIEDNQDIITKFKSEPDKGLYDAMNKGLKMATGKYVWFMNAGDEIAENNAIEKLKQMDADVIYSETYIVDNEDHIIGTRSELTPHQLKDSLNWQDFKYGMLVCHQSFIPKREIAPMYLVDNLSADIDWEINCLKKAKTIKQYPGVLSKYLEGGISHQNLIQSLKDRYKILGQHFGTFNNFWNHIQIIFRADYLNIFRISKYIK